MDFSNVLYGVIGFLGKAFIVYVAWRGGYELSLHNSSGLVKPKWFNYVAVLGVVALFSFACWSGYGIHIEDADPVFWSGGETVVDFEPSDKERNEHGLTTFFVLSIPALYGVYSRQIAEQTKSRPAIGDESQRPDG